MGTENNLWNKKQLNPDKVGKEKKNDPNAKIKTSNAKPKTISAKNFHKTNTDTLLETVTNSESNPLNRTNVNQKTALDTHVKTADVIYTQDDVNQIRTKMTASAKKDSLQIDSLAKKKSVGKKLAKDTIGLVLPEEKKFKKYSVYPFIGTSSLGAVRKVSAIDPRLNDNRWASSPRISYGAYLVFEPNEKWNIRLGAALLQIEKSTFDVPVEANDLNTNFYKEVAFEANRSFSSFSSTYKVRENVVLREQLASLEIPIQVSYSFLKRKNYKIDALTGIGVLYMKSNELSVIRTSGETILLGKNNNYSEGSFGIHLGIGIDYLINESLQIRLEPIFKPQIGFYEKNIENNPFLFNLQFGVQCRL